MASPRYRELRRSLWVPCASSKQAPTAYIAPALPIYDADFEQWLELSLELLRLCADANGTGELERRPLVAFVAPGQKGLKKPERVLRGLADLPIGAVYIQPLRLNPVRDGIEKLVQYVRFCEQAVALGAPVFAGRVGAFGLLLQAIAGVHCFDSGLGEAEAFDLRALNRARSPRRSAASGGGRDRRIYLEPLKTTLRARHAQPILNDRRLRSWFVCTLPCCRWRGFETLLDRRREHYVHVRQREVEPESTDSCVAVCPGRLAE